MASKLVHLLITFICLTYQIIAREWTNSALTLRYHIWGVVCNFGNDQSEVIVVVTFPDHWLYIMTYTDPNAHFPQIWRRFINTLITQHYISAPELMAYIMGWDPNSTFMCYFQFPSLPLKQFQDDWLHVKLQGRNFPHIHLTQLVARQPLSTTVTRTLIENLMTIYGTPTLWLTINPSNYWL